MAEQSKQRGLAGVCEPARSQSPHSTVAVLQGALEEGAAKPVRGKAGQEGGCMTIMPGQSSAGSAEAAKQGAETPARANWSWVEAGVWTERMLSALGNGVKGGKWYSLIDKVCALATLRLAWAKVQTNRGAAGVDGQSVERFAAKAESYLAELATALREGNYRPQAVKRVEIPKGDGKLRPLGIPTVKDRIVQQAVRLVIEPIFESVFCDGSYGFRPERGCHDALGEVDRLLKAGYTHVVDADLQSYLDRVSYCTLVYEAWLKRSGCEQMSLRRRPFLRPRLTWMASISPRLTRCHTVCRETPSLRMVWYMVRYPSGASSAMRACKSSVRRIRQGAPGVSCSPAMMPSLSQR